MNSSTRESPHTTMRQLFNVDSPTSTHTYLAHTCMYICMHRLLAVCSVLELTTFERSCKYLIFLVHVDRNKTQACYTHLKV